MRRGSIAAITAFALVVLVGAPDVAVRAASPVGSRPAPGRLAVGTSGGAYRPLATRSDGMVASRLPRSLRPPRPIDHPALRRLPRFEPAGAGSRVPAPRTATSTLAPVAATTTSAPSAVLPGFQGVAATTANEAGVDPPDPWIAVGPDHVVQAVNLLVRMTGRTGGSPLDTALPTFFAVPDGGFDAHPRIVFDSVHQRWVASEVSWDCSPGSVDGEPAATYGHGYLDVAVSETIDPTGAWGPVFYRQYVDRFPDVPAVATTLDKVIQNTNVYEMGDGPGDCVTDTFVGADFTVTDWSDLIDGDDTVTAYTGPAIGESFSIRTANQQPASTASASWVGYSSDGSGGFDWAIGAVSGTVAAGTIETGGVAGPDVAGPPVEPPSPRQPNGIVSSAIDSRITDAVQQGGRLFAVSTYGCTPAGDSVVRACVRVTQFDTSSSALVQDFVVGLNGLDDYAGGIGLAGNGTLHVVWTRSGGAAGAYPSSYAAYQRSTDPVNSLSAPVLLAAGVANHGDGGGSAGWGAYVGVADDPQVPDAVWQANEYASADGRWATKVSQLQTGGLHYVPIGPTRLVDTRTGLGISSSLKANVPRTFAVTGKAGIPAGVRAITGNVTVTNQTAKGFVSITPAPVANPSTSTLNFPTGDVRANNLTAALGPGGSLAAVFKAASGSTHLVFDVTGYYVDDGAQAAYNPITPLRLLDTRSGVGLSGAFHGNTPRRLAIGGIAVGGSVRVPSTATAITGNLTVVGQTRSGYVSVTKTSQSAPTTSTINFPGHDIRANGVTVPLDGDATHRGVWLVYRPLGGRTADTVHLVLDVTGYFTKGTGGVLFHPLNPGRIMDTRPEALLSGLSQAFEANLPRPLRTAGHWGVPAGATAITGNLTVVDQTYAGFVSVTRDPPTTTPTTSTINFPVGDIRANGLTGPLSTSPAGNLSFDYVSGRDGTTAQLILDLSGYFR
ncbi:MAG TPA: hypothetical protein VFI28_13400 [Candidatus Limnocylindrales bacterium]|nr:hypothetical protein [Candidatus Limnocylindrales bacterium]